VATYANATMAIAVMLQTFRLGAHGGETSGFGEIQNDRDLRRVQSNG